jgi:type VI secretion system protein VasD
MGFRSQPYSMPLFTTYAFRFFVISFCTLTLAACAGSDRPPARAPLMLTVAIDAASGVNPDDRKRAAPILVRIYELKNSDTFNQADFYALQDKDKTVLADDLIARDQFLLRPGQHETLTRAANDASTTLGVLAAYRDLPNSIWRATWTLPGRTTAAWYRRTPKLKVSVDLDANAIRISDDSQSH